jgi:hypothetical protein
MLVKIQFDKNHQMSLTAARERSGNETEKNEEKKKTKKARKNHIKSFFLSFFMVCGTSNIYTLSDQSIVKEKSENVKQGGKMG